MVKGDVKIKQDSTGEFSGSLTLADGANASEWGNLDAKALMDVGDTFEQLAHDCRATAQRLKVLNSDRGEGV